MVSQFKLRDTGCSKTLVRSDLVPLGAMTDQKITLRLADGSVCSADIANVHLQCQGLSGTFSVGVLDRLPVDVLLGNDLGHIPSVALVQTRSQLKLVKQKAEEAYSDMQSSGIVTSPWMTYLSYFPTMIHLLMLTYNHMIMIVMVKFHKPIMILRQNVSQKTIQC